LTDDNVSAALLNLSSKRSAFNLRHQLKAERVQRMNEALHFAKICESGFSRNALKNRSTCGAYERQGCHGMADIMGQIFGERSSTERRLMKVAFWCRVLCPALSGSLNTYVNDIAPFGTPGTTGVMAFGARDTSTEAITYAA